MLPVLILLAAAGAVLVLANNQRSRILAFLIGATAGLVGVQIHHVHLFSILVFVWALVTPRKVERNASLLAVLPVVTVIPMMTTALTGDLVHSRGLAIQFLILSVNAWLIATRIDKQGFADAFRGLLLVCTAASVMSLGQFTHVLPNKGFHTEIIAAGRPYAFYSEPDWAGLFSTLGVVLAFRTVTTRTWRFYALITINVVGSALVAARAAWLAFAVSAAIVGIASLVVSSRHERSGGGVLRGVVVAMVIGVIGLTSAPQLRHELDTRVSSLVSTDSAASDISGQARREQKAGLEAMAASAPWNGHGLSASGHVGVSGLFDPQSTNSVGSNWVLSLWVDAKYLAVPFLVLMLLIALLAIRSTPGHLLAFLCVHNLFSNATVQPITWLALGGALAVVIASRRQEPVSSTLNAGTAQRTAPRSALQTQP